MNRSIGLEIKLLNNKIARKMMSETKMSGYNISPVQIKIIHYLFKNKDKIVYQRDIEKFLDVRRSTVSGILQTMEKNNFINRVDSLEDARLKQIILTSEMLDKAKSLRDKASKFDKLLGKNISKEDLDIFFKVIEQMKENIG